MELPQSPMQIINDYLASEQERKNTREPYPKDHWRASSAGYCMRRVFYERLQVKRTKPDDPRGLRVLSAGNIFHEWAQRIVQAHLGEAETHAEMELVIPDLNVVGHIDNLIQLEQGWTLVDYKSQHSDAFWRAKQNGGMLKPHQRLQIGTYLYGLQKEYPGIGGMVVFLSKDDLTMEQVAVPWDDELHKDVSAYWSDLNIFWKTWKLPPCTCAWEKRYCLYNEDRDTCCVTREI